MNAISAETAGVALAPLRAMLEADGYGLDLHGSPLEIQVVVGEGVCGDCLVPRRVMENMIAGMLESEDLVGEWRLRYPTEHVDG
jgi:hypothetical protein